MCVSDRFGFAIHLPILLCCPLSPSFLLRQLWQDPEALQITLILSHLTMGKNIKVKVRVSLDGAVRYLQETRPACGRQKRWHDVMQSDLLRYGVQDTWPSTAPSRADWCAVDQDLQPLPLQPHRVQCSVCKSEFISWQSDLQRQKCLAGREKPIEEQKGSALCPACHRWFQICGGMAVHKIQCLRSSVKVAQRRN